MPYFGIPIRNGLPIGLGSVAGFGIAPFEPYSLFENGEQGAWYDPSDFSTLFTDSAGTTPVTAVEQFVGLMLDKSKGLVLGPELVTNGNFSSGTTGWGAYNADSSIAASSGELTFSKTGLAAAGGAEQTLNLVIGKTYQLTGIIRRVSGNDVSLNIVNNAKTSFVGRGATITSTLPTAVTVIFTATETNNIIYVRAGSTPSVDASGVVDNISVRELPGNHAFQTNSLKRPKLAARYNLLVGTDTLATQSVTTAATTYTLRFGGTGSIALTGTATGTYSAGTHSITATAGTLTLTVTGSVTTADLRPASQATGLIGPTYQRVVDAATYDTVGFLPYLEFNGLSWSMSTNSIDFSAVPTDKMTVWAGVRKLSDSFAIISELSTKAGANNGVFGMWPPGFGGNFAFYSKGTFAAEPVRSLAAPVTAVLAGIGDISGDSAAIRVNGLQTASSADQGTGNFGNYPMFIGARDNTLIFFNGWLTSLIVRGAQSTQSQIEATESWVAGKTGVSL